MNNRTRLAAVTSAVVLLLTGLGTTTATATAVASTPATFRDFRKDWGGHTRVLSIGRDRVATESVGDGCCHQIIDVTMKLSDVRGAVGHASMGAEVLGVKVYDPGDFTELYPAPQVGDVMRIRIRKNVIHERLTGQIYCDPSSTLPWVCGA